MVTTGLSRLLLPVSDDRAAGLATTQTLVSPSESQPTMTDGAHDAACGCFNFGSSYTPLTPETERNAKRILAVQQGSEPLTLAFSDDSFTVTSTKPDGTGLLDVRTSRLSR